MPEQRQITQESLVVTRSGIPVGELVPLRRQFVATDAAVAVFTGASRVELVGFRADVDALLDQDPRPRA